MKNHNIKNASCPEIQNPLDHSWLFCVQMFLHQVPAVVVIYIIQLSVLTLFQDHLMESNICEIVHG